MYPLESSFTVKPSNQSFDHWLHQEFISAAVEKRLASANLLITPWYPVERGHDPIFVRGSKEFLNYCNDQNALGVRAALCTGTASDSELVLCSYDLFLPDVIVDRIIIPLYVKVMSGYISEKIKARFGNDIRVNAKVTIVDKDRNIATEFSYRGKPAEYKNTVANTLTLIESAADLKLAGESEDLSVDERIERLSNSGKS